MKMMIPIGTQNNHVKILILLKLGAFSSSLQMHCYYKLINESNVCSCRAILKTKIYYLSKLKIKAI